MFLFKSKTPTTPTTIKAQKCYFKAYDMSFHEQLNREHILIGDPYNLDISFDNYCDRQIVNINKLSNRPTNAVYCDIELPKSWVDECFECYQQQKEIDKRKQKIFEKSNTFSKTPKDIYTENFELGLKCLKEKDYDNAIGYFQKSLDTNIDNKSVFYNLACSYCRKNDFEQALQYFNLSFENGYYDWSHIISDADLENIKENPKFVEIIKKMIQLNPDRSYNPPVVVKYILKHDIAKTEKEFNDYLRSQRIQNCLMKISSGGTIAGGIFAEFMDICRYDKYSDWKNLATNPIFEEVRESKNPTFVNIIVYMTIQNALAKHETDNLDDDDRLLLKNLEMLGEMLGEKVD